ncbi:unnamed protein product, partial [marine sediment metagenome]
MYKYNFARGDRAVTVVRGDNRADEKLRGSLETG